MKDKSKKKSTDEVKKLTEGYDESICTDPNGSYTGVPENKNEKPVQDVDDL